MTRTLAMAAVLLLAVSGLAGAASLSLDNGGANFGSGDVWKLSAGIANPGTPVAVDAYLVLVMPDGTLVFFQLTPTGLAASVGTSDPVTWRPFFTNVNLPQGLNTGLINLLNIPISDAIPAGVYTSAFVITQPGTLNIISADARQFLVGRFNQPVASYLGTYNGTWYNDTYKTGGTVHITVADTAPGSLTATLTLGGNVYGLPAPPAFTHAITLAPSGAITFDGPSPLGTVTGTANADGAVNLTLSQIGPSISTMVVTGTILPGTINLSYTVHFTAGGSATGTVTATRP